MIPDGGKQAFRAAYDFLEQNYPPVNDHIYFHKLIEKIENTDSQLAARLMVACYDYLAEEAKKL